MEHHLHRLIGAALNMGSEANPPAGLLVWIAITTIPTVTLALVFVVAMRGATIHLPFVKIKIPAAPTSKSQRSQRKQR
jgi:hypothetical protein